MEQLIKGSTAYKIFCREAEAGRLAHAYMLSFNDPANLRRALTVFALRFFGDDFAAAALRVDEEDLAALSSELTGKLAGFVELNNGLFEVDDVNLVAGAEDVLSHLRVPETGLMAEVATRFEHFTHADHFEYLQGLD